MNFDNDFQHQSDNADKERPLSVAVDYKDEIDELGERPFSPDPDVWQEGYPYRAKHAIKIPKQRNRFASRMIGPVGRWQRSPTDVVSLDRWDEYTHAKDAMFFSTDTTQAPWTVVNSNDIRRARIASLRHVLNLLPYPGKDTSLVYPPEPLICGPASVLSEYGEGSGGSFPLVR